MSSAEQNEEAAARWLARLDRGLPPAEKAMFERWLAESSAHRIAFLRLEAVWSGVDRLAALKGRDMPARQAGRFHPRLLAAALVAVLFAGVTYYVVAPPPDIYVTAVGEHKALQLADGTKIELNTSTQMQAKVTRTARTVMLDRGQAYFEVVHDAKRPFVVIAGNRRITDLGTKFSVFRDGNHIQVVVKEGRVRVDMLGNSVVSAPVFADGGNVVVARSDETLVAKRQAQEIADELNWRSGTLIFNQETLADAADEFNRYNAIHIVVEGKARDIRIGGSFRADNIDVFASLIEEGFGLTVHKKNGEIIISQ